MSDQDKYDIASEELLQIVEQLESANVEKKEIAERVKDLLADAKGRGFDTKIIQKIVAIRAKNPDDVAEEETLLQTYKDALNMS